MAEKQIEEAKKKKRCFEPAASKKSVALPPPPPPDYDPQALSFYSGSSNLPVLNVEAYKRKERTVIARSCAARRENKIEGNCRDFLPAAQTLQPRPLKTKTKTKTLQPPFRPRSPKSPPPRRSSPPPFPSQILHRPSSASPTASSSTPTAAPSLGSLGTIPLCS